jgi:hypothetical protein
MYPFLYPNFPKYRALLIRFDTQRGLSDAPCSIARSCVENILEYITETANQNSAALLSQNPASGFGSEPTLFWVRTHTLLGQNPRYLGQNPHYVRERVFPKLGNDGRATEYLRGSFPFFEGLDPIAMALRSNL